MHRLNGIRSCLLVMTIAVSLSLFSCATHTPKPGVVFPCVPEAKLIKTIAPEAELVDFSCVMKSWKGSDTLHFNVELKNISSSDQRYKVNIFLDNGKAVGGLIPRKTKKGLVKPGASASFVYPVGGMTTAPKEIELFIKTITN